MLYNIAFCDFSRKSYYTINSEINIGPQQLRTVRCHFINIDICRENGPHEFNIVLCASDGYIQTAFNIQLTGIAPEMVVDKPTFPELWGKIQSIMGSGLLIVHNAPFDMGVLAQCLNDYNIEWQPFTYYACTCVMGRACYPNLKDHKLNTLCEYLQLDPDHQNAASDSRA